MKNRAIGNSFYTVRLSTIDQLKSPCDLSCLQVNIKSATLQGYNLYPLPTNDFYISH